MVDANFHLNHQTWAWAGVHSCAPGEDERQPSGEVAPASVEDLLELLEVRVSVPHRPCLLALPQEREAKQAPKWTLPLAVQPVGIFQLLQPASQEAVPVWVSGAVPLSEKEAERRSIPPHQPQALLDPLLALALAAVQMKASASAPRADVMVWHQRPRLATRRLSGTSVHSMVELRIAFACGAIQLGSELPSVVAYPHPGLQHPRPVHHLFLLN